MRLTLLPSCASNHPASSWQFLTTFVVNDTLAVDAGSLGLALPIREQARIRHVLISHTHADHIASLPIFIENVYQTAPECVVLHGGAAVLDGLRRDVFNGRVWPDFIDLGRDRAPFLRLAELRPGEPVRLEGLLVTPVAVDHTVPTMGFILEDNASAVVIASDTGATEELWRRANALPNLKAVFLEASFPTAMSEIAAASKHLTSAGFAAEVAKLTKPARVFAVHLKARYHAQVAAELTALALPNVEIAQPGRVYEF